MKFKIVSLIILILDFFYCSQFKNKQKSLAKNKLKIQKAVSNSSLFRIINQTKKLNLFQSRFQQVNPGLEPPKFTEYQDIGKPPIFKKGWLKFLGFYPSQDQSQKIEEFFENNAFYDQQKFQTLQGQNDEFGSIEIPSKFHFFFILKKNAIYIVDSRRNDMAKTVETINFDSLLPQADGYFIGAVVDQGNFKEGFCFKLRTLINKAYILCTDNLQEKKDWMTKIAILRLKSQSGSLSFDKGPKAQEGILPESVQNSNQESVQYASLSPNGKPLDSQNWKEDAKGKRDGKWIILQDWTQCSQLCGGGTQTLQRQCLPPINGGAACKGQSIITRPCNQQPCPDPTYESKDKNLPTKVRIQPISMRPQRFETCILLEGDIDVIRDDLIEFKIKPKFPGRAVLNNRTFTIFSSDNYDTILFATNLANIGIQDNQDDPNSCFDVQNSQSTQKISLCARLNNEDRSIKDEKDYWINQIDFFRTKCRDPLKPIDNDPVLDIKKRELEEEQMEAESQEFSDSPVNFKTTDNFQNVIADAIQKEMKYEQLAEREEMLREKEDEKNMRKFLEEQREKEECLKRELRKKSRESSMRLQQKSIQGDMDKIKQKLKEVILGQRAEKSKRVEIMKKLANSKKKAAMNQIHSLRSRMAQEIITASRYGNMTLCKPGTPQENIDKYCDEHYNDDINQNVECKKDDEFCFVCCETEFGEFRGENREKCFDQCQSKGDKGNWVWVPTDSKVAKQQ